MYKGVNARVLFTKEIPQKLAQIGISEYLAPVPKNRKRLRYKSNRKANSLSYLCYRLYTAQTNT